MALTSTAIFSCVFLCFVFYVLILFNYYWTDKTIPNIDNIFVLLIFGVAIYMINYYLVVKNEIFLKRSFKKDKLGGFLVLMIIFLIGLFFVIGANKNREKLNSNNVIEKSIN
ncbi:hypothetical protein [Flavobacterium lacisediminis]|uniref:DUF4234 domain-containing protein n=1 Tax=Flavobacterium lacisediminis TaxID=2989705 RepID=A0ABT3EG99_9FLAO|nr:hypothetical protein [Flavobacterium lacisediminis]MCW1147155.1 hypothetical protein [Flavobacterium lacisediminis]